MTKVYYFFFGKTFFTTPTLDTLDLGKDKGTDYVISWKSKGVFNSKFKPLYTAFLNSMKICECRIGITFDKDTLAIEKNNYLSKMFLLSII